MEGRKNTVVRGCLVPSLKNKPLDGRQDVPTLADIAKIENPYVNFIFPVAETGKWYKVVSLKDRIEGELVIPNGQVDQYEPFGQMTMKYKVLGSDNRLDDLFDQQDIESQEIEQVEQVNWNSLQ